MKWNTTKLIAAASLGALLGILCMLGAGINAVTGMPQIGGTLNSVIYSAMVVICLFVVGQFGAATIMFIAMAASYDPDPKAPLGFHLPLDLYTGELDEKRWARWLRHDPVHMVETPSVRRMLKTLKGIFIDCGVKDQWHLHYGSRILHLRLRALKIPHMGWNTLTVVNPHALLDGIRAGPSGLHAYFVHSYQLVTNDAASVVAVTDYGGNVTAMVAKDNIAGTQFHPEKSQTLGLKLIANFLKWQP